MLFRRNKRVSDSASNSSFFTSESEILRSKYSQIILKLYHVIPIIYIRFMLSRRTVTAALSTDTYGLNCRNPSMLLISGSSSPPAYRRDGRVLLRFCRRQLPQLYVTGVFQILMFSNSLNMFSTYTVCTRSHFSSS
jgi:hypothetical protein